MGWPGALRWLQSAPHSADWIYSDLKPNEDDPSHWPGFRGANCDSVYTGPTFRTDWNQKAPKPAWKTKVGGGHSSMTIARGRLYTFGGEGQLFCLEANTGKVVWQKNIYDAFGTRNLPFGTSASPLVAGEKLIITASARWQGQGHRVCAG